MSEIKLNNLRSERSKHGLYCMAGRLKCAVVLLLFFIMAACLFMNADSTYARKKVRINHRKVSLYVGEKCTLSVKGHKKVKWKSSNRSVARVSSHGTVRAVSKGKTVITARVSKRKAKCRVSVRERQFYASKTKLTVTKKASVKIFFVKKGKLKYSIDNTDVISCEWADKWNEDNIALYMKPVRNGKATVTVTNPLNKKKIKIDVSVEKQPDSISKITDVEVEVPFPDTSQNNYVTVTYNNSGQLPLSIPDCVEADGVLMYSRAEGFVNKYYILAPEKMISVRYYTDVSIDTVMRQLDDSCKVKASVIYNGNAYIINS